MSLSESAQEGKSPGIPERIIADRSSFIPGAVFSWDPLLPLDTLSAVPGNGEHDGTDLPRLDPAVSEVTAERIAELIDEIKLFSRQAGQGPN